MNNELEAPVAALVGRFGAEVQEFRGQITLMIAADHIADACQVLRDEFDFNFLEEETAVDYWPEQEPRFHVVYQLYSLEKQIRLGLRVPVPGKSPSLPTLVDLFANANWREREIWDMFGIRFEGHPDLRRILMPHDWQGHPLRKDYPLGYEEVQFSFNAEEIDQNKPYAEE
jgi:NADH-quinone oxidoreductase subunit C